MQQVLGKLFMYHYIYLLSITVFVHFYNTEESKRSKSELREIFEKDKAEKDEDSRMV